MGKIKKRILAGLVALGAVGTTVSGANSLVWPMLMDGSVEDRAATIFTYQNQVSSALAQTIVDAEAEHAVILDALYAVEEQLNVACAPVQEAGRRHIDDEPIGGLLQLAVLNSMEDCEAKTDEVAYYVRLARGNSAEAFIRIFEAALD
ncbi:hypothetical protein [Pelagibius sp.]|uniref:hypothetical protein n=1 Tax=Pelagibius sp. TaxID=1931238 RepID=UPI003B512E93